MGFIGEYRGIWANCDTNRKKRKSVNMEQIEGYRKILRGKLSGGSTWKMPQFLFFSSHEKSYVDFDFSTPPPKKPKSVTRGGGIFPKIDITFVLRYQFSVSSIWNVFWKHVEWAKFQLLKPNNTFFRAILRFSQKSSKVGYFAEIRSFWPKKCIYLLHFLEIMIFCELYRINM